MPPQARPVLGRETYFGHSRPGQTGIASGARLEGREMALQTTRLTDVTKFHRL